jgi:DNA modification methylase
MNPTKNLITASVTDRKFGGGIVSKSSLIVTTMESIGYQLKAHKIWVKTLKIDGWRPTYANILTFGKGKTKQNLEKSFKPDVWIHDNEKYKKYAYGMAIDAVIKCVLNYTVEGDVVYDPFMGSGTTAAAAIRTDRKYVGSEINEEYFKLSQERIHEENIGKMLT